MLIILHLLWVIALCVELMVGFEQTTYTFAEEVGSQEVCVTLTSGDIGSGESVVVAIHNDPNRVPSGLVRAGKNHLM